MASKVEASFRRSFAGAVAALAGRESRKLRGTATYLHRVADGDGYAVAVKYHETDVVTYHADGTVSFRSGGWQTGMTKARWNEYAPPGYRFGARDRVVWVSARRGDESVSVPFAEGMRLADRDAFGSLTAYAATDAVDASMVAVEADRQTRRAVNRFVRTAMSDDAWSAVVDRARTDGTGGDCWFCSMIDRDGTGDPEHLREHVREGYAMVSLAVNACRERGRGDPFLCATIPDIARRDVRAFLLARLLVGPTEGRRGSGAFAPEHAGIGH